MFDNYDREPIIFNYVVRQAAVLPGVKTSGGGEKGGGFQHTATPSGCALHYVRPFTLHGARLPEGAKWVADRCGVGAGGSW